MNNFNELPSEIQQKILQRVEEGKTNPAIFIDRFLYTFNPKQQPYHFPFKLFEFQKMLAQEVRQAIDQGYDIFIEKCREMGATYTVLDVLLWFWRYVPGSNFLVGSRKEDYVDNTKGDAGDMANKEESLFGKLEYTLNKMPPLVLPEGFNIAKHMTYMSLINPENGNIISGESANPNFSRGGRQKAILFDEFAFWDNGSAAWGATADTTQCRIVLTTPGIKPSKAKRLRFGIDGEQIKVLSLPYYLDPRKNEQWLAGQRTRRAPDDFAREIMINWDKAIGGIIYTEFNPDIHVKEFDHQKDQYGDYYFGQDFAVRGWTAGLAVYVNSEGVIHILDEYKQERDTAAVHGPRIIEMLKLYAGFEKYVGYADPAGFAKTQQGQKNGREMVWSLADDYIEQGFPIIPANNEVTAGINFVKQLLYTNKLVIHKRCTKLIEELEDYRWKEQSEKSREELSEPESVRKINDHLVDALRYVLYSKPTAPDQEETKRTTVFPIIFGPPKIEKPEDSEDQITPIDIPSYYDSD